MAKPAKADIAALVSELLDEVPRRKLYRYKPYEWQARFHNAGRDNAERLLMAGNGCGKTHVGAAETAFHLTGDYPSWWEGRRFEQPVNWWVGSISNQAQKEYTQPALLGADLGENLGTGMVPKALIVGKPRVRQAGIADVCDTFQVRHKSGGVSNCSFKSYEQGWRLWQGAAPDGIWMDEQMDENAVNEKPIFTEAQTRVFRKKGILYATLTPLLGETDFIRHFLYPKAEGIFWMGATWDDAPHLDPKERARLEATYPDHERDVRTKGVPMMGSGRVFAVSEDAITCKPFEIPPWYARICGLDFGIDHPFASCWIAWDRDKDVLYLYDCLKVSDETPVYHAEAVNRRGNWIPVSWPHDGLQRGKADGRPLKDQYAQHGVRLLSLSARYDNDVGGGQPAEPVVLEMLQRMKTGGFFVFDTCTPWLEEFRSYHRKDGKIVNIRDDAMKASMYAVMMKRYAATNAAPVRRVASGPVFRA